MTQLIHELDIISHVSFHIRDDDQDTLKALKARASELATQLSVLERLEPTSRLIRLGKPLPMRKLSFNIRKLSDANLKTDSQGESRWTRLQSVGCEAAIFCMLAFNGLATLAGDEFEWLLENVQRYMAVQYLPFGWISSDQIRQVMARVPRQPNILPFLESTGCPAPLFIRC
jgi:hypothetical protein